MTRFGFDIEPFTFRDVPPATLSPRRLRQRRRLGTYDFETLDLESPGMPTLRIGSRGSAVIDLQTRLATAGFSPGPADGIFGSRTDGAVRSFQRARGLKVDGVVGPLTWGELLGTTAPQPAPGTGSPSPAPGSGAFPAAWSNGPVNAPIWHPSLISHSSIECGSKSIPAGLQPESVSQGWTARTQRVASMVSGSLFNWREVNGRVDRTVRAPSSNHYCGRAIDAFPPGVRFGSVASGNGLREGWRLANWAAHNAQAQNISEVIFFDRIWTVARSSEGWRPYTNPMGSTNTLQHRDHVHISVY
jgi:peptidoglycan hydrolase-like protein with peptidoglycan-binding domain